MKNHNFPIGKGKYWKDTGETENKLLEYLSGPQFDNLSVNIQFVGEGNNDGWMFDGWIISFQRDRKEKISFDYRTGIGLRVKNKFGQKCATMPHIAMIMQSLLLDSQADEMSFNNWCSDYGYDNDSIRALKVYQTCCETAKKLYSVFNGQQIAEMRKVLQDY